MSIDRSEVMRSVAAQELSPEYRRWLREHDATDAEGFQVLCSFGPDEPALDAFCEINDYEHSVIVCSVVDGQLAMVEVGDGWADPGREHDVFTVTTGDFTVADVLRATMSSERGVAVEFAPSRSLVASR